MYCTAQLNFSLSLLSPSCSFILNYIEYIVRTMSFTSVVADHSHQCSCWCNWFSFLILKLRFLFTIIIIIYIIIPSYWFEGYDQSCVGSNTIVATLVLCCVLRNICLEICIYRFIVFLIFWMYVFVIYVIYKIMKCCESVYVL